MFANNIEIDKSKCVGCGLCKRACPGMLLDIGEDGKTYCQPVTELNWSGCWKCQHCLAVCPQGAISVMGKNPENSLPIWPEDMGPAMAKLMADRTPCDAFKEDQVDDELMQHILTVMTNTPTGGNKMMVEYTVVSSKEVLDKLDGILNLGGAPHLFVPHVPGKYENTAAEIAAGNNSTPVIPEEDDVDTSITLAYFEMMAGAHGLGTAFVDMPEDQEKRQEAYDILQIPAGHIILKAISFGYPVTPRELPENMGSMMDSLVAGRTSCRHFKQENVDKELLKSMFETLNSAAETSGRTLVEYNLFDDIDKVNEIRAALVKGYEDKKSQGIYPYSWNEKRIGIMESRGDQAMNGDMFFCSSPQMYIPHMSKEYPTAAVDTSLNLAYFEILAASYGLGVIYLGFSINVMRMLPDVYDMLEIPEGHFMVNVLGFGYPEFKYTRGTQKDGFVNIHLLK